MNFYIFDSKNLTTPECLTMAYGLRWLMAYDGLWPIAYGLLHPGCHCGLDPQSPETG